MDISRIIGLMETPMKNASEKYPLATLIAMCLTALGLVIAWRLPEIIAAIHGVGS